MRGVKLSSSSQTEASASATSCDCIGAEGTEDVGDVEDEGTRGTGQGALWDLQRLDALAADDALHLCGRVSGVGDGVGIVSCYYCIPTF